MPAIRGMSSKLNEIVNGGYHRYTHTQGPKYMIDCMASGTASDMSRVSHSRFLAIFGLPVNSPLQVCQQ